MLRKSKVSKGRKSTLKNQARVTKYLEEIY